jgi:hypothetical protein
LVFRMHWTGGAGGLARDGLVQTNFVQTDAASSGSAVRLDIAFPSAGPGPNSFVSSLQNAGALVRATSRLELATVEGRGKSAAKKTVDNLQTTTSGQAPPTTGPVVVADVTNPSLTAANLEFVAPLLQGITGSTANVGSIPPPIISSRSDATIESATEAGPARQGASAGSAGEFPPNASPRNAGTIVDSAPSVPGFDASRPAAGDPASPSDVAAAPVKQAIPLPVGGPRPQLSRLDESEGAKPEPAANSVPKTFVVNSEPTATLPSTSANLDELALLFSPSAAESAGNAGSGNPHGATPVESGKPLPAFDPTSSLANADVVVNPPALDSQKQSGNGVGRERTDALFPLAAVSSRTFSAEIAKPMSQHAVGAMKATETIPPADARTQESPATRAPTNPEHMPSKASDSFPNRLDANVQPSSGGSVSAPPAGQLTGGEQLGNAAPTANVLAQILPTAIRDSGSPNAAAPAAERQPSAASAPSVLPAVATIEVARLVAGVAQSEMHIGLRTQAFGSVELHTVVRDSQVGLTVGSEKGDLRTLLAAELSGLQMTFRQQDLRFENIRFLETTAGTTAGFSGGTDSQGRSSSQQYSSTAGLFSIHSPPEDPVELDIGAGLRARLNVHA